MKARTFVKYGYLFLAALLVCPAAWAQELFPELNSIPARGQQTETQAVETQATESEDLLNKDTAEPQKDEDTAQIEQTATAAPQPANQKEDAFDVDPRNPARLRMYITDINGALTPGRAMSYCFANLKLQNQINRQVQQFSATVTYGKFPIKFQARNIAPGATVFQNITMVGSACEMLINAPQVDIAACSIDKMTTEECKSKFIFEEPAVSF